MTTTSPLGIRQNNPGNLRDSAAKWQGQTGSLNGFCVFDTPENGLRALCLQLVAYSTKHGLNTVRGIIGRWAPPSENDTGAYVTAVANGIGRSPDAPLPMTEPGIISGLCSAIVNHENGQQPYAATMIATAARIALGLPVSAAPVQTPAQPPSAPPAQPTPAPAPSPPVVAPAPKPKRQDEAFVDLTAAQVAEYSEQYRLEGATITVKTQPDGRYSLRATF